MIAIILLILGTLIFLISFISMIAELNWTNMFLPMFICYGLIVAGSMGIGKEIGLESNANPKQIQITYDIKDTTLVPVDTIKIY